MAGVRVSVTSTYNPKGINSADAGLAKFQANAERATGRIQGSMAKMSAGFEAAGAKMSAAGTKLTSRVTLPLVAALGLAVKEAAQDAQSQATLAQALKNTVGPSDKLRESVEKQIMKWQSATGVLDDKLRPAYGNLIRATHDVGKANTAMGLTLDISAAKHLDVEKVSIALGKAYQGNVTGLQRLGIKVKDASGKTLSFGAIMKSLSATFKGQAAAAANTVAGRMTILKARIHELTEQIGSVLLPMVDSIVGFIGKWVGKLNDLNPNILKWAVFALVAVAALGPLLKIGGALVSTVGKLIGVFAGMSAPMLILVAVIIAAALAFKLLWDRNEGFRRSVKQLIDWVKSNALPILQSLWSSIKDLGGKAWETIERALNVAKIAWFTFLAAFNGGHINAGGIVGFAAKVGTAARAVVSWFQGTALPAVERFASGAGDKLQGFGQRVLPAVQKVGSYLQNDFPGQARAAGSGALAGIQVFVTWVQQTLWPFLQQTVGFVVAQFAGLVDHVRGEWGDIQQAIHNVLIAIGVIIAVAIGVILVAWNLFGDDILRFVQRAWAAVRVEIQGVFNIIKGIFDVVLALLTGKWGKAWNGIKEILSGVWQLILGTLKTAWATLQLVFGAGLSLLKGVWSLAWNEIKALPGQIFGAIVAITKAQINIVFGFFKALPGRLLGLVGALASAAGSIGSAIMNGIISGVTGAVSFVGDLAKSLGQAFIGFINQHIIHPINDAIGAIGFSVLGHHVGLPKHVIPDIPGAARGADVRVGGLLTVGEHGSEVVSLPRGARVFPHGSQPAGAAASGGSPIHLHFEDGRQATSADDLAHSVVWRLRASGY